MFIKKSKEFKELDNIVIGLPFEKVFLGKVVFDVNLISTEKRVANLYMRENSLTETRTSRGIKSYYAEFRPRSRCVDISSREGGNGYYSCSNIESIKKGNNLIARERILNGFTFITAKRSETNVSLKKFEISRTSNEEEEYEVKLLSEAIFYSEDKNLKIKLDGKEIDIKDLFDFYDKVDYKDNSIMLSICALIYDTYSLEKGFLEIEEEFKSILLEHLYLTEAEHYEYIYYCGQYDFYLIVERLLKSNMRKMIADYNPAISKKPLCSVKDVVVLSEHSKKLMVDNNVEHGLLMTLEQDEKIGKNGIALISEFLNTLRTIDKKRKTYGSPFEAYRYDTILSSILDIVNNFDISVKVLLNRMIKAIFIEGLQVNEYLRIVTDTIIMAKSLDVKLDKKLPNDIIRLHDVLQEQIMYIKNQKIEDAFKALYKVNKEIFKELPVSADFDVLVPTSPKELIDEGLKLNHCVGSYIDRYASGYSKIYLIRRKSAIEYPYVTMELDKCNKLVQIKGSSNSNPNKEVMDFVKEWINNIEKVGK